MSGDHGEPHKCGTLARKVKLIALIHRPRRCRSLTIVLLIGACLAADRKPADKPYMGWSSWSLEAVKDPAYGGMKWLTAEHVQAQSIAMHDRLQSHGFNFINLDSGWRGGFDEHGRPTAHPIRFPKGMADLGKFLHDRDQKFGLYFNPGIPSDLYEKNPQILGSPCHIRDIVFVPRRPADAWKRGYAIDFSKPGAQEYVNSIADLFLSWKIDFLKLDGVTPGSGVSDKNIDARGDVKAWSAALQRGDRPVWFTLSWAIDDGSYDFWKQYADAWRITQDIESYGPTLIQWKGIRERFSAVHMREPHCGIGKGWNDLDSIDVANGDFDGVSHDEKQTMMTFWSMACSPLYLGDDLTRLDESGLQLLSNDEVIAIDQAGRPATQMPGGDSQIWIIRNPDHTVVIGLFNLAKQRQTVSVKWKDLALPDNTQVRDVWTRRDVGIFNQQFTATLDPHACQLIKVSPAP